MPTKTPARHASDDMTSGPDAASRRGGERTFMKRNRWTPASPHWRSPAVMIATLGLIVAMSGAAGAAAAPLTEKAVKKIARSQVTKLAPTLSVARAKTADDAAHAASADNAAALGGAPASAYLLRSGTRADGVATSADIPLTTGPFATILTKTVTVPTDGYVFVIGTLSATWAGAPGATSLVQYGLTSDGSSVTTDAGYHGFWLTNAIQTGSGALSAVIPVTAGPHTFALTARDQGGGSTVSGRDLSLMFTPSGSGSVQPY
jgi:hypothetical protein